MSRKPEPAAGPHALARQLVPARTAWAGMLAYSRAVRVGDQVFVAGTLPVDAEGQLVGGEDAHQQACQVLRLIQAALAEAGASTADVVRLRIYLRDHADFPAVAAAQFAVFEHVRPACTVVQSQLAGERYRVQMEAEAVLPRPTRASTHLHLPLEA